MKMTLVQKLNHASKTSNYGWPSKKLKLNKDKTEFLITSKYHQSKPNTNGRQIASSEILASPSARNLRIIVFDNVLSMEAHIKNACKTTYFQIQNIDEIRNVLDDETASKLVHDLIAFRLGDNGNYENGITESQLKKTSTSSECRRSHAY